MSKLDEVLKLVEEGKTLPMIVTEVMRITADPNANIDDLSKTIEKDPILSAKIIRTVNSAFFSFVSKAESLDAAIVRLGMKKIKNLTMSLNVAELFTGGSAYEDYNRVNVWKHSVVVGMLCELLVKHLKMRELQDDAFLAGLVHDIGIILLDQLKPKSFFKLPGYCITYKAPMHKMEEKAFAFNHAEFGAAVLGKWRFPETIINGVREHHTVSKNNEPLADVIALSDLLALKKQIGYSDLFSANPKQFSFLVSKLGLTAQLMKAIDEEFDEKIEEVLGIFSVEEEQGSVSNTGRYVVT